jgi:hypothetical protein
VTHEVASSKGWQEVGLVPCRTSSAATKISWLFRFRSRLVWALIVSLIIPAATSANPPERVGGSNFAWYSMDGCSRDQYGIVSDYPRNKSAIDGMLNQMFGSGQRRLRLPVFYSDGFHNATILKIDTDGLNQRDRDNFAALIATIARIGFEEVIVASFPFGPNNPVAWKKWQEDRYHENWTVITQLRRIMDASSLPYKLDLQNEGVPFPFQLMLKQFVHRVWQDYVHAYGPTNTIGVSVIPKAGRLQELPQIYGGVLPGAFDLHISDDADKRLLETDGLLRSFGIGDTPFIIGEALYNDETEASELETAAKKIHRRILFLTQWPVIRNSPCQDVAVIPLDFSAYRRHGF